VFVALPANPLLILVNSWPAQFNRFIIRDIVVNVALYVPAGLTGHLAFRRFGRAWLSLTAPVLICAVWSATIEIVQLFVPTRDTSALDLSTNIIGSMIGVVLGIVLEDVVVLRHAAAAKGQLQRKLKPPDRSAVALLFCWLSWLLFPLFPVLGHTVMLQKVDLFLRAPIAQAVPFFSAMLAWMAGGNLLQAATLRPARRWLAISLALIPAQLLIVDRQPLTAALVGAIAGVLFFSSLWPLRKTHRDIYWKITAWAFLATIAFRGLAPFHFSATALPFSWIPFNGFLNMSWQSGIQVIAEKFFWYGTAIWLMRRSGMRTVPATALVASVLLGIEIAQTRLSGHVAEITDPLWAVFTSAAIAAIARNPKRVNPLTSDGLRRTHASDL
jgi:glycopeptide antibiotics resistance protein